MRSLILSGFLQKKPKLCHSQCFTAAVFWLIFKWEANADEQHSSRYLVLIGYLMGISIGVHLLNLLTIPALVFVYYFKKFPTQAKALSGRPLLLSPFSAACR